MRIDSDPAERDGISLNQYFAYSLTRSVTAADLEARRQSFEDLRRCFPAEEAEVAGVVEDSKQGFLAGQPGTLLEVKVLRSVKSPGSKPPATVLVLYTFATMPVADGMICGRGDRGEASPESGSQIVVFAYRGLGIAPRIGVEPEKDNPEAQASNGCEDTDEPHDE